VGADSSSLRAVARQRRRALPAAAKAAAKSKRTAKEGAHGGTKGSPV